MLAFTVWAYQLMVSLKAELLVLLVLMTFVLILSWRLLSNARIGHFVLLALAETLPVMIVMFLVHLFVVWAAILILGSDEYGASLMVYFVFAVPISFPLTLFFYHMYLRKITSKWKGPSSQTLSSLEAPRED
ncbi:hypothetical protein [Leptospira fletcheri]|nr:hypothetical protein [Leptospira fletcheri]